MTATPDFFVGRRVIVIGPAGRSIVPTGIVREVEEVFAGGEFHGEGLVLAEVDVDFRTGLGPPREYSR